MKERLDRITITVGNDLQEALPAKGMDKRLLLLLYPGMDQVITISHSSITATTMSPHSNVCRMVHRHQCPDHW
jgi:hypothetical protein